MEVIGWLLKAAEFEASCKTRAEEGHLPSEPEYRGSMPEQLKALSKDAVRILSTVVMKKMSGEDCIKGHEIVNAMKNDSGNSPAYIKALDELEQTRWLELIPDNDSKMKMRPWCWLQAQVEMGSLLLCQQEEQKTIPVCFSSNEEYLDCVVDYISQLTQRLDSQNRCLCGVDTHSLPEWVSDEQFREIEARLALTTISVTAAEIKSTLNLSGWQYLYLMGVLGYSERVIKYDFSEINEVIKLFASGYNLRRLMREHLVGKESPLMKYGLLENEEHLFSCGFRPTPKAIRLITGKPVTSRSFKEISSFVAKETLFELDCTKVKTEALLLSENNMETIRTIIHAEKPAGRKIRAELLKNMPSGSGCPTGTTILLYGPPGTGKTLTASCIASQLKLPVLKIDCANLLGRYIGESEKNVKKVFEDYETICRMLKKRPLILLNEADQLLARRMDPHGSAEQSSNNVQNLFLEALERFKGIMVATTNKKELLDSAYDRRFTYKLELEAPTFETRQKLWESHLPVSLIDGGVDMKKLATYPLTGGEIRLVLEQAVRSAAYRGCTRIGESLLMELADKESRVSTGKLERKIGFGA